MLALCLSQINNRLLSKPRLLQLLLHGQVLDTHTYLVGPMYFILEIYAFYHGTRSCERHSFVFIITIITSSKPTKRPTCRYNSEPSIIDFWKLISFFRYKFETARKTFLFFLTRKWYLFLFLKSMSLLVKEHLWN